VEEERNQRLRNQRPKAFRVATEERSDLQERVSIGRRRYLVFTSAGDRTNLRMWLAKDRGFDLWITYYGDHPDTLEGHGDYWVCRKGSKFQNLRAAYQQWPDVFVRYEAVLVLDDDVLIRARDIDRLFAIRAAHELWLLQPAFDPRGKISWDITKVNPHCRLRYTNFVEMTCPLFRQDKLADFMAVYDPELVGFGVDWWFLHVLGADIRGRVAVIDEVVCLNPHDRTKGRVREIDRLQPYEVRKRKWGEMKRRYGIKGEEGGTHEYGRLSRRWYQSVGPVCLYRAYDFMVSLRWVAWAVKSWVRARLPA
jgi:hypothetical protein